jgi:hypothetical protein
MYETLTVQGFEVPDHHHSMYERLNERPVDLTKYKNPDAPP